MLFAQRFRNKSPFAARWPRNKCFGGRIFHPRGVAHGRVDSRRRRKHTAKSCRVGIAHLRWKEVGDEDVNLSCSTGFQPVPDRSARVENPCYRKTSQARCPPYKTLIGPASRVIQNQGQSPISETRNRWLSLVLRNAIVDAFGSQRPYAVINSSRAARRELARLGRGVGIIPAATAPPRDSVCHLACGSRTVRAAAVMTLARS